MAAFERTKSGIPEMDAALDNIRLGDNVVWQVSDLDEFRAFSDPYVRQAIEDERNLIYVRFASHEPLVEEQPGVRVIHVPLSHRFETFTIEIHELIEAEGYDAFYVFDCLSELQTAWSTDLMMGNFFKLTCPFLFTLDTIAFFPVIRGKHSYDAIAKIRDTTQLFLDVYRGSEQIFVRPMKVWNRYSDTMFLPHGYNPKTGEFKPLFEGVQTSEFYRRMNAVLADNEDQNIDSWERFFTRFKLMYKSGMDVTSDLGYLCDIMLTRDPKLRRLIRENFTPRDYFEIRDRMIGTGMIGGKATGMLLARKLIENNRPDIHFKMEPHDSFYIGSDVFYAFIVDNGFWDVRIRQRRDEEYFTLADTFAECVRNGKFEPAIRDQFCRVLDYYGQDPCIVRSSSILEDGFGNAFAGKYESVFVSNLGTMSERLEEFENAVRTVYASTMNLSALDYRKRRDLHKRDEQMAILVQRVSGSHYESFYTPCAAGVGYSVSPYKFSAEQDQSAGMLRLVMGLGTAAVDRTASSYPRLVPLDDPEYKTASTPSERHKYSQRKVDVIKKTEKGIVHQDPAKVEKDLPAYLSRLLLSHDYDAERTFRNRGQRRDIYYVSCDGIVKNQQLMADMRDILAILHGAYDYPVDIEFTINLDESGSYVINLLQCRPLQVMKDHEAVQIPEIPEESIFLECEKVSMGFSRAVDLDYVVYIDAMEYFKMPYALKSNVAHALGKVNWYFREQGKHLLLFTPGRICTSSPELGVPAMFADISEFDAICEVSESRVGYTPELSYGSHIFQDLVEAGILYTAVFDDARTIRFKPELFAESESILDACGVETEGLEDIIRVCPVRERGAKLYYDMGTEHMLCAFEKRVIQK